MDKKDCNIANPIRRSDFNAHIEVSLVIIVFFTAIVFGVFSVSIFSQQIYLVANATSTVDKKVKPSKTREEVLAKIPLPQYLKQGVYQRIRQVMGEPGPLHLKWLSPKQALRAEEFSVEHELNMYYI